MGIEYVTMDELLAGSDVISLHCPLMESTHHLIDEKSLSKMKSRAFLINTARGGLVDTLALIHALENGIISGAAVDVYEHETALFFSDRSTMSNQERMVNWDKKFARLSNLPNVIVSPHIAFLTNEALENIVDTTVENIDTAFWKEPTTANDIVA
jgi:D-lactate dehydrogenase